MIALMLLFAVICVIVFGLEGALMLLGFSTVFYTLVL